MAHNRENNILGQIVLWLIAIGLFLTANDDENHWSVRIGAAATLSVFPFTYCVALGIAGAQNGIRAGDITNAGWGAALVFFVAALAVLGWFLSIVARSAQAMENNNAWPIVVVGPMASAVAIYFLWQFDLGWIHFLAIPACYFVVCAMIEGLFADTPHDDSSSNEVEAPTLDESDRPGAEARNKWRLATLGTAVLVVSVGAIAWVTQEDWRPRAASDTALNCNTLAEHPWDSAKSGPGVSFQDLDVKAAATACSAAVELSPNDGKQAFQYSRVLLRSEPGSPDARAGLEYLQKAAELEYPYAQAVLGYSYLTGSIGLEQNDTLAHSWALRAHARSEPHASALLGEIYRDGRGVAKNAKRAADFFDEGSQLGSVWASYLLGLMYATENANPTDMVKAKNYLEIAAKGDVPSAQYALGVLITADYGSQEELADGIKWLLRAAQSSDTQPASEASFLLFELYQQSGNPDPKTMEIGEMWLARAAELNNAGASSLLATTSQIERWPTVVVRSN